MFEAQLLMGGSSVYSPWFARGGESVICTVDVAAASVSDIEVRLFTKNSEDSGEGADSNTSLVLSKSGAGRASLTWDSDPGATNTANIEELVRYKFTATDAVTDWVLFRVLSPVWFDSVKA